MGTKGCLLSSRLTNPPALGVEDKKMCDKIKESTIADKNYVERKYTANVAETERNAKDVLLSSRLTNPPRHGCGLKIKRMINT